MTAAGICTLDGLVGRNFRCIVADPPWRTTTGPQWKYKDNGHKPLSYPVMSMDEIKALPVGDVADDAVEPFLAAPEQGEELPGGELFSVTGIASLRVGDEHLLVPSPGLVPGVSPVRPRARHRPSTQPAGLG